MDTIRKKATKGWLKPLAYLQIAVQIGMSISPLWINSARAEKPLSADDSPLNAAAGQLNTLGQAAQSGNFNGLATQQASSLMTQQLQQWLQNFGTARIELNANQHFTPRSGAVDLLLPLDKSNEHLFFTQGGFRQVDGELTGNMGLGMRHFVDEWMFGYNAFYDQNISRGHKRLGTGVEAWRDYVKLSGNGYWRLSDWRNSGDVTDYDARPANGFDLRAEAWLPAYPALGGRMMYEKYYGDEVALFGKDKRQRNPDAVTAGLSWTPIPLISFTADHKKGGQNSETAFGLQLSWQLGQSLASQIDPTRVGDKRTLAGSAMDLVERNNNIVLEYRKQQLIDLFMSAEITGESSKVIPLVYKTQGKYGFSNVVWNDAALVAAGGKVIDQGNGSYQLALPKYLAGSANSYAFSGIAHDTRGNVSKAAYTTIKVTPPALSMKNSSVGSAANSIIANGSATTQLVIKLIDDSSQPIRGMAADIKVALKEDISTAKTSRIKTQALQVPAVPASIGEISEQTDGSYIALITAGTRVATLNIATTVNAQALPALSIQQISDADSAVVQDGDLKLEQDATIANGKSENRVRARVTDASGNPVAGINVTFSLSGSAQVVNSASLNVISDNQGYANLMFTNTVAETVTVMAKTANGGSTQVESRFIADNSSAVIDQGDLTHDRNDAPANGASPIIYTALVKDANGNPIPAANVKWTTDLGKLSSADSSTDANGKATVNLTSTQAGLATLAASVNGAAEVKATSVIFVADSSSAQLGKDDLKASKTSALANGIDTVTYTAQVKDAHGNPVTGATISWANDRGNLDKNSTVTDKDGSTSVTLSSTRAGTATISASVNNGAVTNAPIVTFIADSSSASIGNNDLTADKTNAVANGSDAITYSALVKDAQGNPVVGMAVSWSSDRGNLNVSSSTTDNAGKAEVHLSSTAAGDAIVSATVNNKAATNAQAVSFSADQASATIGSGNLQADKSSAVANGNEAVTYTAQVKDAHGNPVQGIAVSWTSDHGDLKSNSSNTDQAGKATIQLSSTLAGTAVVSAAVNNGAATPATAVTFIADNSTAALDSEVKADKTTVVANGTEAVTYTAQVKDAHGNPLPNIKVNWTTNRGDLSATSSSTNGAGEATIQLSSKVSGDAILNAALSGGNNVNAANVAFTADVTTAQIKTLTSNKVKITGNSHDTAILTAIVEDANGNKVANYPVQWTTTLSTLSAPVSNTDDSGKAEITLNGMDYTEQSNTTATISASTSVNNQTLDVIIRTVFKLNGVYYWTMVSDHNTDNLSTAQNYCNIYGQGHVLSSKEGLAFLQNGGDFRDKKVSSEYTNAWLRVSDYWNSKAIDLYRNNGEKGDLTNFAGVEYVCVK